MRVWTVQREAVWQTLQRDGLVYGMPQNLPEEWCTAYTWMIKQMKQRIKGVNPPAPGAYPIWVWRQWDDVQKKMPDLRYSAMLPRGERGVRLELEVEPDAILFSDFSLWHYGLNYWYLPRSMEDGDRFEEKLKKHGMCFYEQKPVPDEAFHREIVDSWEIIFDLDWKDEEGAIAKERNEKSIQGTMWELRLDQVQKIKEFVAR